MNEARNERFCSNYEDIEPQYMNPAFENDYRMAQSSIPQQTVTCRNETVRGVCTSGTEQVQRTKDKPCHKNNLNNKTILVLMGCVTALSLVVGIVALALAAVAYEKQNSFAGEVTEEIKSLKAQEPSSCLEILAAGETRSGIFTIRPETNGTSFSTFCDMTSGGGGWTLVASVHENNIDGKCTVGDKWSSEQGMEYSALEDSGSWENFEVFGDIDSVTSLDYKNPAYFNLKASDIMLWHVPNNVNINNIEEQAFLKYYTSDGFLVENGSTLRNFFAYCAPLEPIEVPDLRAPLSDVTWFEKLRDEIPDFYSYTYDRPTLDYIEDGGRDMYDRGNRVSFAVNSDNYISVTYGEQYGRLRANYTSDSAVEHPFMFLTWIGFGQLDYFRIRVTSNTGADGNGRILTYTNSFHYYGFLIGYRVFQVYDAPGDPSICEVYFYISNTQKWKSTNPLVDYPRWSIVTDPLDNEIQLQGAKNIFAGYTLLSRSSGNTISESQIIRVMQLITDRLEDTVFPQMQTHVTTVTFEKGSIKEIMGRVPTSQESDVKPGYIEFQAYDEFGYPYALCPGLEVGIDAIPSIHCVGGINSNWNGNRVRNPACGDFADWNRGNNASYGSPSLTGRSLEDIQSSILIFTRDGQ